MRDGRWNFVRGREGESLESRRRREESLEVKKELVTRKEKQLGN